MRTARVLCTGFLTLAWIQSVFAQPNPGFDPRFRIGDTEQVEVQSPSPYSAGPGGGLAWQHAFHKDGATFVRVHFADETQISSADVVKIRDGNGLLVREYSATDIAGRWTPSVDGSTLQVELWAAPDASGAGIVVDMAAWGTHPLHPEAAVAGGGFFTICDTSVPARIRTADPVTRLTWVDDCGGVFLCSGWLFSPQGHMMTNAHCANSQTEANNLECWFNYVPTQCDLPPPIGNPDVYDDAITFIQRDCDRDFAVHKVFDPVKGNPADRYGYLEIVTPVPPNGTQLWIPQHPSGIRKQIAENCVINDNLEPGFNGCADPPNGCGNGGFPVSSFDLSFNCGIAGGSSGSPVLNTNDQVIAIAHAGNGVENFGVRMFNIAPLLPNPPISLEVIGPASVDEEGSMQLTASADYLIGNDHTVTNFVDWVVTPGNAGTVSPTGLFTANNVVANLPVTITATYTEDEAMVEGELMLTVINTGVETPILDFTLVPSVNPMQLTPGQNFFADVMVSTDGDTVPNIRLMQLDMSLSSGVTINSVDWSVNPLFGATTLYGFFQLGTVHSAFYPLTSPIPGFVLSLNGAPQAVARVNLTFNANGQLNVLGAVSPPTVDESVRVLSGFESITEFSQAFLNVSGGNLPVSASAGVISIVSSDPPTNSIDARQPSNVDGTNPVGWQNIDLTFNGAVAGLTIANFSMTHTLDATPPPTVVGLTVLGANTIRVSFTPRIFPGAWTTVTHNPSGTSARLGYLPADVDANRSALPFDILQLIDSLNGIGMPRPIWSTDINRTGLAEPSDILREIDLLNGAGAFDVWNGVSLP